MIEGIQAYPLAWPEGWKRSTSRKSGKFTTYGQKIDTADGVRRVLGELEKMGVDKRGVVISSNLKPRLGGGEDNLARTDPGVAVYWQTANRPMRVIAVDLYSRAADNLAAIAATLDAMRAIDRHGGAVIMDRAFTGFTALPPPERGTNWWEVLGVSRNASPAEIKEAHRQGVKRFHNDLTGDNSKHMAEINAARDKGLAERTLG